MSEKAIATHSSTLAWKIPWWRSLVGCSPWGHYESDMTERLHFHFSLSCIGEGNGNPLQCSCLEKPRYGGAWWAAVYGVTQSWTRLKRLSSSSNAKCKQEHILYLNHNTYIELDICEYLHFVIMKVKKKQSINKCLYHSSLLGETQGYTFVIFLGHWVQGIGRNSV